MKEMLLLQCVKWSAVCGSTTSASCSGGGGGGGGGGIFSWDVIWPRPRGSQEAGRQTLSFLH